MDSRLKSGAGAIWPRVVSGVGWTKAAELSDGVVEWSWLEEGGGTTRRGVVEGSRLEEGGGTIGRGLVEGSRSEGSGGLSLASSSSKKL